MKKYLFIIILFFCMSHFNLHAQKFNIQEGVIQNTKSEPLKIIGLYQGDLISISQRDQDLYLVKYDKETLKPKQYVNLPLSYKSKKVEFIDIIKINNRYLLITRFNNKKKKESYYLSQEIAMESLKVQGVPTLWSTSYFPESYEQNGFFMLNQSADKSKTLIVNSLNSSQKGETKLQLRIYKNDSTPLFQKDIALAINQKLFDMLDVAIDNRGSIFLLGRKYFNERQEIRNGKLNFEYIIYEYSYKTETLTQYKIDNKQKVIIQFRMALNKHQKIICAAISYDENAEHRSIAETYTINKHSKLLESHSQQNINFYKLTGALADPNTSIIPSFRSQGIVNGNKEDRLVFLAEYQRHQVTYGLPPSHLFYYLNTIAIEIDSMGNIINDFEVKKLQSMKGKKHTYPTLEDYHDPIWAGSYSYIFAVVDENYIVAYNESSKNLSKEKWNKFYLGDEKNTIPFLVYLDKNHKNEYYRIIEDKKTDLKLYTNAYYQSGNELYLIVKKNGGQEVIKVTFRNQEE